MIVSKWKHETFSYETNIKTPEILISFAIKSLNRSSSVIIMIIETGNRTANLNLPDI